MITTHTTTDQLSGPEGRTGDPPENDQEVSKIEDFMQDLKNRRIWMGWRFETRKGKRTKVPKSVVDGRASGTSDSWSHTWGTFAEAAAAKARFKFDGIGFRIPEGVFFVDIDGKTPEDLFARKQMDRLDSYTERSVSGNGLHTYGLCDLSRLPTCHDEAGRLKLAGEYYTKNPHNQMELYIGGITNRFAVYTGDVVLAKPMKDCTMELLGLLNDDMRRAGAKTDRQSVPGENPEAAGSCEDWEDIVDALLSQKNSDKFRKLFIDGDISGYNSASEADCALCAIIAFRTGDNPKMIDAIFRMSALCREKWDRQDYREKTIRRGIEACHGVFHRSKMPMPDFIIRNKKGGGFHVSPPLLAKYVREHTSYLLVRDDGKQAMLKYVYNEVRGVYEYYADEMFRGMIKSYIEAYDPELLKMKDVKEVYDNLITDRNYHSQRELNADESLINFQNCLLRVTGDSLTPLEHTPDVYSTIQIPGVWSGKPSPTPVFDAYMDTLTGGNEAVKQLLLEFIGVCVSNVKGWRMKKALFLTGDGNTGKSQYKSLIERLLGDGNFMSTDMKEIEVRFGTGAIYGVRLAGSSDMGYMSVDELKTFKKLTGGDSVFAEFKGQQGFQYTFSGLLCFCMNRLPHFGGDDGPWVYDRIMVVKCQNVIPEAQQDKELLDKMYAERDGIIYKAVKALQTVIANGYRFSEPEEVKIARTDYRAENNSVIAFFLECMCVLPKGKINPHCTTGMVYRIYKCWCRDNNNGYAKTAREFREELARYLGKPYSEITTRQKGNTYYKEYTLTLEVKETYTREYGYDDTGFMLAG